VFASEANPESRTPFFAREHSAHFLVVPESLQKKLSFFRIQEITSMVRKSSFTVELVNAETKETFKEHSHTDGSYYVEVEPDAEYWIRISSHRKDDIKKVHNKEYGDDEEDFDDEEDEEDFFDNFFDDLDRDNNCAECVVEVDGRDLRYSTYVSKKEVHDLGIWSRTRWKETNRALRFKELKVKDDAHFWIGTVKVDFYKAIENRFEHSTCNKGVSNHWKQGVGPQACAKGKKAVKSCQGTTTKTKNITPSSRSTTYERGDLLETITLRYCTTVGLLYVGVLPKPTTWEHQRRLFPAKPSTVPEALIIQPQIVNEVRRRGSDVLEETSHELFDLTDFEERQARYDANNNKISSPAASRRKQPVRQLKRKLQSCNFAYDPDDEYSDDENAFDDDDPAWKETDGL
jgi:hypothetical protein